MFKTTTNHDDNCYFSIDLWEQTELGSFAMGQSNISSYQTTNQPDAVGAGGGGGGSTVESNNS